MSLPNRDLESPNDDGIHSDYLGRRSYWESIRAENNKLLDEQLVFLSSGALIFSISVVDLLGPYYNFLWLGAIWTLFTLSLLCRVVSCYTGERNADEKIKILDQNRRNDLEGKSPYKHDLDNDTIFQPLTKRLNSCALVFFGLGVIFFFPYAIQAAHFKNTQMLLINSWALVFFGVLVLFVVGGVITFFAYAKYSKDRKKEYQDVKSTIQ